MPSALLAASLCLGPALAAGPNTRPAAAEGSGGGPRSPASDAWLDSRAVQATLDSGAVAMHASVDGKPSRHVVEAAIRIEANAREIWPLVTRCRYAAWIIPGLKRCRTLERAPDGSWADIEHVVQFSLFAPTMRSVFRADFHPPYLMDFHRIAGNLEYEVGSWSLLPAAGGSTTVVYRVSLQPAFWVPNFVVQRTLHKQLPAALRSLRKHAQQLATDSPPPAQLHRSTVAHAPPRHRDVPRRRRWRSLGQKPRFLPEARWAGQEPRSSA